MTDTTEASREPLPSAAPPLSEPSSWHELHLTVNGRPVRAQVESRLLLSDFLRARLSLTGTHVGCEHGVCGACTVLVDGEPVRSCLTLAVACEGASLRTVESLADEEGPLTDVQRAFHEQHAMQCGFCTAGFVMSCTAMVEAPERPTEDEVADQLSGHLCRCTGYGNIRAAVEQVLDGRYGKAGEEK